jgi:hypothetical protein
MPELQGNNGRIAFVDRLLTACLAILVAALTLLLFPIGLLILGNGFGGGSEFDLAGIIYSAVMTGAGAIIVVGVGVLGFWLGSDRMISAFSFIWGTHGLWSQWQTRIAPYSDRLSQERAMPAWLAWVILLVLALVGIRYF